MNKAEISRKIKRLNLYNYIEVLDSVDSTNDHAKRLLKNQKFTNGIILAREQTAGRGRLDRYWFSPPKKGLWMTVVIPFDFEGISLIQTQFPLSLGVFRAVDFFVDSLPELKWPNDILISGRKICGLLSESFSVENNPDRTYCLFGIGINVKLKIRDFPDMLRSTGGSLEMFSERKIRIDDVCIKVLKEVQSQIGRIRNRGFTKVYNEWKSICSTLSKTITFEKNGKEYSGVVLDVCEDGSLLVETVYKEKRKIFAGDISYSIQKDNR